MVTLEQVENKWLQTHEVGCEYIGTIGAIELVSVMPSMFQAMLNTAKLGYSLRDGLTAIAGYLHDRQPG